MNEERLPYSDLKMELQSVPATWIPALFRALVWAAHHKQVFGPGGATALVAALELGLPVVSECPVCKAKHGDECYVSGGANPEDVRTIGGVRVHLKRLKSPE